LENLLTTSPKLAYLKKFAKENQEKRCHIVNSESYNLDLHLPVIYNENLLKNLGNWFDINDLFMKTYLVAVATWTLRTSESGRKGSSSHVQIKLFVTQ
jgi:hypothetical protein